MKKYLLIVIPAILLSSCIGSTENIESIISEICDIEEWYDKNGCYKPTEWNELKKAKDFLQKK